MHVVIISWKSTIHCYRLKTIALAMNEPPASSGYYIFHPIKIRAKTQINQIFLETGCLPPNLRLD